MPRRVERRAEKVGFAARECAETAIPFSARFGLMARSATLAVGKLKKVAATSFAASHAELPVTFRRLSCDVRPAFDRVRTVAITATFGERAVVRR